MTRRVRLLAALFVLAVATGLLTGAMPAMGANSGHITGHLTDQVSGSPIAGYHNAFASVSIRQANGIWVPWTQWSYNDSLGNYDIANLPAGTYRVAFFGAPSAWAYQAYRGKLTAQTGDDVVVGDGQTVSSIDATLAPASFITGRVTERATGAPVPGVMVEVRVNDGSGIYPDEGNFWTDASGVFSANGLAAGSYRLWFVPDDGKHLYQTYGGNPGVLGAGQEVEVGEGQTVSGIDMSLLIQKPTQVKLSGRNSVRRKTTYRLSGSVSPSASGTVKVSLFRLLHKRWRPVGSATRTLSGGRFTYSFKPRYKGTWRIYAKYGGTQAGGYFYSATSATKTFRAK